MSNADKAAQIVTVVPVGERFEVRFGGVKHIDCPTQEIADRIAAPYRALAAFILDACDFTARKAAHSPLPMLTEWRECDGGWHRWREDTGTGPVWIRPRHHGVGFEWQIVYRGCCVAQGFSASVREAKAAADTSARQWYTLPSAPLPAPSAAGAAPDPHGTVEQEIARAVHAALTNLSTLVNSMQWKPEHETVVGCIVNEIDERARLALLGCS